MIDFGFFMEVVVFWVATIFSIVGMVAAVIAMCYVLYVIGSWTISIGYMIWGIVCFIREQVSKWQ